MGSPYGNLSANSKNIKNFQVQQKFKGILVVFIIGVPVVIAILSYTAYRNYINPSSPVAESTEDQIATNQDPTLEQINGVDPNAPIDTSGLGVGGASGGGSTPSAGGSAAPTPTPTQSGIPEGVTVAVNSIEANGIKNSPYVALDTSGVPDGTVIKIDRSTWTPYSADQGAISGTITAYGQTRNGSLTFNVIDGTWRVVSYSVDS